MPTGNLQAVGKEEKDPGPEVRIPTCYVTTAESLPALGLSFPRAKLDSHQEPFHSKLPMT